MPRLSHSDPSCLKKIEQAHFRSSALTVTSSIEVEASHQCFLSAQVCPDPVDKYLEETSVRYISPRGAVQSKDAAPHRRTGVCDSVCVLSRHVKLWLTARVASGPQPVLCCSPSGPQVGPPRIKSAPPASNRKRKRSLSSADCREKQTCGKERGYRLLLIVG